jgi:hypothetical protein
MARRYQIRRDYIAEWASENPILADGEIGMELETKLFKIGDGDAHWSDLSYARAMQPEAHAINHSTTDPLTLSDISPTVAAALPAICGADNKLLTLNDVQSSGAIVTLTHHVGATLQPVNNTHYVITSDLTLITPASPESGVWNASLQVAAGVLLTFPGTWKLTGYQNPVAPTIVSMSIADGTAVHAELVSYPRTIGGANTQVYVATWGNDSNSGLDWMNPKLTIDAGATTARAAGLDLWIAYGTYVAPADDYGFNLSGLTVYGGFEGNEITIADRTYTATSDNVGAGTFTNETILVNRPADRATAISVIQTPTDAAIINGITFTEGKTVATGSIQLINCKIFGFINLTGNGVVQYTPMWNCTLSNNRSMYGGAAYKCVGTRCLLNGNSCSYHGGAAYDCSFFYSTFDRNRADSNITDSTNYGDGGGAYAGTYANCTFTNNFGHRYGGGLSAGSAPLNSVATDCTFINNKVSHHRGGGAGTTHAASNLIMTRCTFLRNWVTENPDSYRSYGGGSNSGLAYDCIYIGNWARTYGACCSTECYRCIFIDNFTSNNTDGSSPTGNHSFGDAHMYNCIFARHARVSGSDISSAGGNKVNCLFIHNNYVTVTSAFMNCILWRNSTENGTGALNLLKAANGIALASFVAPLDVTAAIPTASVTAFDAAVLAHAYDIAAGSVAINAGNDTYNATTQDMLLRTRKIGTIDCGPYEKQT